MAKKLKVEVEADISKARRKLEELAQGGGEGPATGAAERAAKALDGAASYERSLAATRRFLRARGLPSSRSAYAHLDTWMDGRDLDEAERLVREGARSSRLGLEPTCVFNALFEERGGGASGAYVHYSHDLKARTAADCQFKLDHARPQFSTSPASERDPGVIAWMSRHFPDPSPWERS